VEKKKAALAWTIIGEGGPAECTRRSGGGVAGSSSLSPNNKREARTPKGKGTAGLPPFDGRIRKRELLRGNNRIKTP